MDCVNCIDNGTVERLAYKQRIISLEDQVKMLREAANNAVKWIDPASHAYGYLVNALAITDPLETAEQPYRSLK